MVEHISKPVSELMASLSCYDRPGNELTGRAFQVLRQLTDWFAAWHPHADVVPNVRVSRTLVALCIGDHVIWSSNENIEAQLSLPWVLNEWAKGMIDDLKPIRAWQGDAK